MKNDRVGLRQDAAVGPFDHRHLAGGIALQEFGGAGFALDHIGLDPAIGNAQPVADEFDLQAIARNRVAVNYQRAHSRFRLPPLPNSSGLRFAVPWRWTPIQPNSPEKRPCSILGHRSMITVRPAPSASLAASSLTTPSCIQTYL